MWTALHAFQVPSNIYNKGDGRNPMQKTKGRPIVEVLTIKEMLFNCHFTCSEGRFHSSPLCKGLPNCHCHHLPNLLEEEELSKSCVGWVTQQTRRQILTLSAKATQLTILSLCPKR